jgi:SAM-dependent methyltransferase
MFDYEKIPEGYYDKIFDSANGMRKFWHWHKFDSINRVVEVYKPKSLIDIGCFAGSFIGRFVKNKEIKCLGVDILDSQIEYAKDIYSSNTKDFEVIKKFSDIITLKREKKYSFVTFIEVIEHLNDDEIFQFFDSVNKITEKGSVVAITTPNYTSLWPVLELMLNYYSDVSYEEQHINKFNFFNLEKKLQRIYNRFNDEYEVLHKTTSHFLTPYISLFSYGYAVNLSKRVDYKNWHNPFGAMIILILRKK